MKGTLSMGRNLKRLDRFMKKDPERFTRALEIAATQFLTWANTGQGPSSAKPPIRFGILRGSSSAFVGGKLVEVYPQNIKPGSGESPTPAKTHSAPDTQVTWVWNTDYAKKMHEWQGGWGEFTRQDGDAGNKWLEKHLQADKNALFEVIGKEYKKLAGT